MQDYRQGSPKVSIGVPVYNGERYLRAALDSLLDQTFTDFEIVISDNCSTDSTAAICAEYAARDPRVRYLRTAENQGAVENFNRLVGFARGKYFKWAAHDDAIAPTYLERCVPLLESDPSVVMAHSLTQLIDQFSTPIAIPEDGRGYIVDEHQHIVRVGYDSPERKLGSPRADERFAAIIRDTNWVYEIFGLFRLDPLKRTGLMEAFYGGDKLLLAQIVTMGRIAMVPEPLFLNRRHAEQSTNLSDVAEQEAWIDPRNKMGGLKHRWRRLRGFMLAALNSQMSLNERILCVRIVSSYYIRFDRWRQMFEDVTRIRHRRLAKEIGAKGL